MSGSLTADYHRIARQIDTISVSCQRWKVQRRMVVPGSCAGGASFRINIEAARCIAAESLSLAKEAGLQARLQTEEL